MWLRSLHTDARYYDDPLSFNPDRWDVSTLFTVRDRSSIDQKLAKLSYLCTDHSTLNVLLCISLLQKPPKPGTYQVFGGGPRVCAGNMLARLQLSIMLHHLAVGYK